MESERRLTHRLVDYWQQIKGDRPFPMVNDIDPDEIADMWEYCYLIQISKSTDFSREHAYSLTFLGRALQSFRQQGDSAHEAAFLMTLPPDKLDTIYTEMLMTRLPIVENVDDFYTPIGVIKYRQAICPIGTEDGQIRGIFGGMRFKVM